MSKLMACEPFAGLNRRFPQHKLTGKDKQFCQELMNMTNIDGRVKIIEGAQRLFTNTLPADIKWAKRIYYSVGGDEYKHQFLISNGFIYRLTEATSLIGQVPIDNDYSATVDSMVYPIDAQFKVSQQLTTLLVDGTHFFKFNGNLAGNWNQLPIKLDIDGNTIEPIFIANYLDRSFVITKKQNQLIVGKNLNPEVYDDSTDCAILELPPGNGGYPVGLLVYRGILFIIHEDYIAPLSGNSLATFGVRPGDVNYGYGSRAPRSVCIVKNQFGFLNREDNEYYLTSGTLDSTKKVPLSYPIKLSEMMSPTHAELTHATVDSRDNLLRIAYYPSGGNGLGDEVLYSLSEEKWCGRTTDRKVSCYSQWNAKGDDNRIITGRSDIGKLMWNSPTYLNFDEQLIHYKFVSASYIAEDNVTDVQFERFWMDMLPYGNSNVPLGYVLEARLGNYGAESMSDEGEVTVLGLISIANQDIFLNSCIPLIDRSKGRMIRFEIEETQLDKKLEFYGIYAHYNADSQKQSKYLVGQ